MKNNSLKKILIKMFDEAVSISHPSSRKEDCLENSLISPTKPQTVKHDEENFL